MTLQTTIFRDDLASNAENFTDWFEQGLGFYLIAPASEFDYQIDIFLQVELSSTVTRMVRLEPMNVSNTQRITLIPPQIINLGLPMRLSILPSDGFFLEVILLQPDYNLDDSDDLLQFLIDNLLPLLIDALLPEINNLLISVISNLLLPAISELLTGNSPSALPATTANSLYLDFNFV